MILKLNVNYCLCIKIVKLTKFSASSEMFIIFTLHLENTHKRILLQL